MLSTKCDNSPICAFTDKQSSVCEKYKDLVNTTKQANLFKIIGDRLIA